MAENTGENKAKLTALAQLIQILADYKGITTTPDLVAETGYTERAIYKAKAELRYSTEPQFMNQSADCTIVHEPECSIEPEFMNLGAVCKKEKSPHTPLKEKNNNITPIVPLQRPSDCQKAFEAYNDCAAECGLPKAVKLTPDRKRKIAARLKDYGLDGWMQALDNIRRSRFLTGSNDRNFRADLDFVLQAKSFNKLHDGGYGNGRHAERTIVLTPEQQQQQEAEREAHIAREIEDFERMQAELIDGVQYQ